MKIFVRPYPQAVAGEIGQYAFDAQQKTLRITCTQTQEGESVIATPLPVQALTVDGEAHPFTSTGAQTVIRTAPGQHTIILQF